MTVLLMCAALLAAVASVLALRLQRVPAYRINAATARVAIPEMSLPAAVTSTPDGQMRVDAQAAARALGMVNSTVRAAHLGIADIPFGILDAIPGTRGPSNVVRAVHHGIAGGIYGAIGAVTTAVAQRPVPHSEPEK